MNNCPGNIIEVESDTEGYWIAAVLNIEGTSFILLNVYGYNGDSRNKILLEQISCVVRVLKAKYLTDYTVSGRRFQLCFWCNRFPTSYLDHEYNPNITRFCNDNSLIDVW